MSQSCSRASSPLSSVPNTPNASQSPVRPASPLQHSSSCPANDPSAQPEGDLSAAAPQSTPDLPSISTITINSGTALKRACSVDDEDEAQAHSQPSKKPASDANVKAQLPPKTKAATKKAAPRKIVQTVSSASTRPSRNRKAPERFEDVVEQPSPRTAPAKKGPGRVFDPVFITTNSTSRLVKADIYHMLLEPSAWTSLTTEQQISLISMLPQDTANSALLQRLQAGDTNDTRPPAFTLSNDCFRTDVAKFKEDLKNGHLAKTWQAAAQQAIIDRAAGEFDAWKADEAELWWGQKAKPNGE